MQAYRQKRIGKYIVSIQIQINGSKIGISYRSSSPDDQLYEIALGNKKAVKLYKSIDTVTKIEKILKYKNNKDLEFERMLKEHEILGDNYGT